MNDKIEHQGVIESITDGHVRVSIMQVAACSECKAKALCTSSESKEKYIDVYGHYEGVYQVGDTVKVCGSLTMGRRAVLYAFVWPTVLVLLTTFVVVALLHQSDGLALAVVFGVLAVYFLTAYFNRGRIEQQFAFWIESAT